MWDNELTSLLKIKYPIIQAPMAGGTTTSELVTAVSNSGALGMIGAGYMQPDALREQIREIRQLTENPFGVNLFVPSEFHITADAFNAAYDQLQPIRDQLSLSANLPMLPRYEEEQQIFHELVQVVIEERVSICSFTFGIPSSEVMNDLKRNGIITIGTATTVKEAKINEEMGMDAVVVQGTEAGGHRGTFDLDAMDGLIGLMSLVPQVVDEVNIPVIAAGGIMDGRGLMASLCLGAKAVQMGTAFLCCEESGAHALHKEAILQANDDEITLTRTFSGKWARGIRNRFIAEMRDQESSVPDFPIQNRLTNDIRKASAAQHTDEFMSLWSGQSPKLAKKQTVHELISGTISQATILISNINR